jgi:hypothetical protein
VSGDLVAWTRSGEGFTSWAAVDQDLNPVDTPCGVAVEYPDPGCGEGPVSEDGRIVSVTYADIGASSVAAIESLQVTDLRTGERRAPITSVTSPGLDDGGVPVVDVRGRDVLLSTRRPAGRGPTEIGIDHAQAFDVDDPDAQPEVIDIFGQVQFLSAPLVRAAAPDGSAPEPEEAAASQPGAPTFEEIAGATVPSLCDHPPTTLVDGANLDIAPNNGDFQLLRELPGGGPAVLTGIPSNDRGPLTLVIADCYHGGVGWPHFLEFFSAGAEHYAESSLDEVDWESIGLSWVARSGVAAVRLDGDSVVVDVAAGRYEDAMCCPSSSAQIRLELRDGGVRVVDAQRTS